MRKPHRTQGELHVAHEETDTCYGCRADRRSIRHLHNPSLHGGSVTGRGRFVAIALALSLIVLGVNRSGTVLSSSGFCCN